MQGDSEKKSFGFKTILAEEKERLVKNVFSSVANKYDLMNDLMSAGVHRFWKNELLRLIIPTKTTKILDIGGGTGDIAFKFIKQGGNQSNVTICDINPDMLKIGKERALEKGYFNINWIEANAEKLPFPDNTFDVVTISFCIRNVTNIDIALSEAFRVLKKGGRFYCLEFSQVTNPLLSKFYDFYSFNILPEIGRLVAKDKESYQYLVESIRKFPSQDEFLNMIKHVGFKNSTYKNLNNGIVAIHFGLKA